jgi:hypothetical protein
MKMNVNLETKNLYDFKVLPVPHHLLNSDDSLMAEDLSSGQGMIQKL